ncbi:MAG: hypothetical protein ACKOAS_03010 [Verrucomicrobiota bacterium]
MKTSLTAAFAAMALPALLCAQEQERKLLDRIQRPDMELSNPMQKKSFERDGGVSIREAPIARAYAGTKDATAKEFAGTKSFFGIKNPWFGNRVFEAREAPLMARGGGNLAAAYPVRDARVGDYKDSTKKAALGQSVTEVRPFLAQGGAQGSLDQISDKIRKEMTIDEVRELLNKPR